MARLQTTRSVSSDDLDRQGDGQTVKILPENEIWAAKRVGQKNDMRNIASGKYEQADMVWFTPEQAKRLKAVDSLL